MSDSIEQPIVEETIVEPIVESVESSDDQPIDPDFVEEQPSESFSDPQDSKNVAKRIGKLAKKLSEKDAELAHLREQLKAAPIAQEPGVTPRTDDSERPKLADFDSIEEYTEAVADYKFEQRQAKQQAQSAVQAKMDGYNSKVAEFMQQAPDFTVAVQEIESQLTADNNVVEFLLESDFGPNIAYHLANHEEELGRLMKLSSVRRIAALSKIENEMSQRKNQPKASNQSIKQPVQRVTANTGSVAKSEPVTKDSSYSESKKWRESTRKK